MTDEENDRLLERCIGAAPYPSVSRDVEIRRDPVHGLTLFAGDTLWMSAIPAEFRAATRFLEAVDAGSAVLMTGLGLGLTATAALFLGAKRLTVVESSIDVIALVHQSVRDAGKQMRAEVEIVNHDAFTYVPTRSFDLAWHDIWLLPEDPACRVLVDRYAPYVTRQQYCW